MNGYWLVTASSTSSVTATCSVGTTTSSTGGIYCTRSTNVWKEVAAPINNYGSPQWWVSYNPTVGAGHVFVENDSPVSGAGDGSSFAVAAFSNIGNNSYIGHSTGNLVSGPTSVQDASYSPAASNNLLVSILGGLVTTGPSSLDSGFIITDAYQTGSSLYTPIGMAYLIAPNTSAVAPTWTVAANGNRLITALVEFAHA